MVPLDAMTPVFVFPGAHFFFLQNKESLLAMLHLGLPNVVWEYPGDLQVESEGGQGVMPGSTL